MFRIEELFFSHLELSLLPSLSFRPVAFLAGYPGPWSPHIPFACDLVSAIRPNVIVELGTHYGDSYFTFCQTVAQKEISCTCYAVDTWRGDPQAGFYDDGVYEAVEQHNSNNYRSFSYLLRSEFDQVLNQFSDESIALLHIDGLHTYEAVRHDFHSWYSKVQPGGIVLFHDVAVRSPGFGVWRFWEELQATHRCFTFHAGQGLGVLEKPGALDRDRRFIEELFSADETDREAVRRYYNLCSEHLQLLVRGVASWTDTGHISVQVFFSRTGDYSEADSTVQVLASGRWSTIGFKLPPRVGRGRLRVDICNRTAVVDINSVEIRRSDQTRIWQWLPGSVTEAPSVEGTAVRLPTNDCLRVFSYGSDPQLYLPEIDNLSDAEALELEIQLRVDPTLEIVRETLRRAEALDQQQSELQVFFALDGGYREQDSMRHLVTAGAWTDVVLRLPSGSARHSLRIDICDCPAMIDVAAIELRQVDGVNVWRWQAASMANPLRVGGTAMQIVSDDSLRMFSYGTDPQLYLPEIDTGTDTGPLELEIRVRIDPTLAGLGEGLVESGLDPASIAALESQREDLRVAYTRERQARLDMEQSRSWQVTRPFRKNIGLSKTT